MKILIAGGAGFLGSHLCENLFKSGHEIICIDNLHTGRIENIKHLLDEKSFKFIDYNIIEPLDINCDLIMNFACPASPVHYQLDPLFTIKTCFIGTLNLLENAKKYQARFLQASTSEVYGDPNTSPQQESYWGNVNPIGIRSCYDEGKRSAETLCTDFSRMNDIDLRIIRIFNTYGPNMLPNDGRVVSNFIVQCLNNEDITVFGDGTQTRSFCYVDDLVDGIIKTAFHEAEIDGPVNLGNPNEFKVAELANKIKTMTNSNSKISYKDLPSDDPKQRCPDISKANLLLGWKPEVTLEKGLIRTIEYFSNLNE